VFEALSAIESDADLLQRLPDGTGHRGFQRLA
jgi:hypothetical protein